MLKVVIDPTEHGDGESGGFASSGLRLGDHVDRRIGQQRRNRRFLDFGRMIETHRVHAWRRKKRKIFEKKKKKRENRMRKKRRKKKKKRKKRRNEKGEKEKEEVKVKEG